MMDPGGLCMFYRLVTFLPGILYDDSCWPLYVTSQVYYMIDPGGLCMFQIGSIPGILYDDSWWPLYVPSQVYYMMDPGGGLCIFHIGSIQACQGTKLVIE